MKILYADIDSGRPEVVLAKSATLVSSFDTVLELNESATGDLFVDGVCMTGDDMPSRNLYKEQVNRLQEQLADAQRESADLRAELQRTESSRMEWIMRFKQLEGKLDESRLAFRVLVSGGKEQ